MNISVSKVWNGNAVKIQGRKVVGKSIYETGLIVEAQAKSLCPVDQGRLSASITTQAIDKGTVPSGEGAVATDIIQKPNDANEVLVGTPVEYAEYQEFVRMRDSGVDMGQYAKVSKQAKEYDKYSVENVRNDVDLQKEVVREDLRLRGMEREEIEDMIESLEDTNKLSKKAESAVANLSKFKDAQLQRLQDEAAKSDKEREDATKKQLESYQKFAEDSKEIIPGVKLNKQKKDKLYDMIVKPSETYNGQPVNALTAKMLKDPIKFNYILASLIDAGVFDGKWDSLIKVGKSKAIEDLTKAVETGNQFKVGVAEKGAYANMYKDLKELNKKV